MLVEAVLAHTTIPSRIERLTVIEAVPRADDRLGIDTVSASHARSPSCLERTLWEFRTVAGAAPFVSGKRQPPRLWPSTDGVDQPGVDADRIQERQVVELLLEGHDVVPAH